MSHYTLVWQQAGEDGEPLQTDLLAVKKAQLLLKTVNHTLRQQILKYIGEKGSVTVTEIHQYLLLDQSMASQQLALLRRAGFVKTTRKSKFVYYSLHTEALKRLNQSLETLLGRS